MNECPTCGAPVNLAPDGDPRYDPEDMTTAYMVGYEKGKDAARAANAEPGATVTLCARPDCRWQVTGPHYPHGTDDFGECVTGLMEPPWRVANAEREEQWVNVPTRMLRSDWPPNPGLMPGDARFDEVLDSIRAIGIQVPLHVKADWSVIDGMHRLYAAWLLGLPTVPVRFWTGSEWLPTPPEAAALANQPAGEPRLVGGTSGTNPPPPPPPDTAAGRPSDQPGSRR